MSASATQGGHKMSLCRHSIRSTHTHVINCSVVRLQIINTFCITWEYCRTCCAVPSRYNAWLYAPVEHGNSTTSHCRSVTFTRLLKLIESLQLGFGTVWRHRSVIKQQRHCLLRGRPFHVVELLLCFLCNLLFLLAAVYTVNKVQYHDRQMPNWCNVNHLLLADWCHQWLDVNRMRRCFVTTS